jgi:hypothetical protein
MLAFSLVIDAAILDVQLGKDSCEAMAEALHGRGIPFAFASGYGAAGMPSFQGSACSTEAVSYRGAGALSVPTACLVNVSGLPHHDLCSSAAEKHPVGKSLGAFELAALQVAAGRVKWNHPPTQAGEGEISI